MAIPYKVWSGGDIQFTGLNPRTSYYIQAAITYSGGTVNLSKSVFTTGSQRPGNWYWESSVSSGSTIRISAGEWNRFCSRINEFREYAGLSGYRFTWVYSGEPIYAYIINEAYYAIREIPNRGGLPPSVSRGDPVDAYTFNQLRNALNQVP